MGMTAMLDSVFNSEEAPKLSDLETQLEAPVVPGELAGWLEETNRFMSELLQALHAQVEYRHRDEFNEIAEQDPGLLARVEQLRSEDQKILTEAERQFRVISSVARNGDKLEPDEARAIRAVEKIVAVGLELVIRVRKQEAAINTWLIEAFDRDRGVAD